MIFISTVDDSAAAAEAGQDHHYVASAAFQVGDVVRMRLSEIKDDLTGVVSAVVWSGIESEYKIHLHGATAQLPVNVSAKNLELKVPNDRCLPEESWAKIENVQSLVPLLLAKSTNRAQGASQVQPVLLRAGAGTGKTWAVKQLFYFLSKTLLAEEGAVSDDIPLVPIVIYVQRLARLIRNGTISKCGGMDLVLAYIREEFANGDPDRLKMIEQAIQMRAVVCLIDGVDEAANLRKTVEDIILRHIVPIGIRVVVTSRPEGVRLPLYKKHFVVLNLKPLSDEQQRTMIGGQLSGNVFFEHLMACKL